jgi:hypothetical protein
VESKCVLLRDATSLDGWIDFVDMEKVENLDISIIR